MKECLLGSFILPPISTTSEMDLSTLLSSLSGRNSGSSRQSKMTVISQGEVLPQQQKRNYNTNYYASGPKRFECIPSSLRYRSKYRLPEKCLGNVSDPIPYANKRER